MYQIALDSPNEIRSPKFQYFEPQKLIEGQPGPLKEDNFDSLQTQLDSSQQEKSFLNQQSTPGTKKTKKKFYISKPTTLKNTSKQPQISYQTPEKIQYTEETLPHQNEFRNQQTLNFQNYLNSDLDLNSKQNPNFAEASEFSNSNIFQSRVKITHEMPEKTLNYQILGKLEWFNKLRNKDKESAIDRGSKIEIQSISNKQKVPAYRSKFQRQSEADIEMKSNQEKKELNELQDIRQKIKISLQQQNQSVNNLITLQKLNNSYKRPFKNYSYTFDKDMSQIGSNQRTSTFRKYSQAFIDQLEETRQFRSIQKFHEVEHDWEQAIETNCKLTGRKNQQDSIISKQQTITKEKNLRSEVVNIMEQYYFLEQENYYIDLIKNKDGKLPTKVLQIKEKTHQSIKKKKNYQLHSPAYLARHQIINKTLSTDKIVDNLPNISKLQQHLLELNNLKLEGISKLDSEISYLSQKVSIDTPHFTQIQ